MKISHVKNVNKRKNRFTSVNLESKKQDKKVLEGLGRAVPIDRLGRATSYLSSAV